MTQKKPKKERKSTPSKIGDNFTAIVKIMTKTPPITNEEITKHGK